ncbi:MAG: hypothetical protein K2F87_05005 [Muribaculaceae bacterium]|nr:hypothetical protein [Muribaculaceae bacterium]
MKHLIMAVMVLAAALVPASASAQGLGGLVKKAKKSVEKVLEAVPTSDASNPLSSVIDIEPVGLYGVSTTENYGNVYLVLKVTMKVPEESVLVGSSINNQKMLASAKGKVFNIDASGATRYDTPADVPVYVVMDQEPMMFQMVPRTITQMDVVKVGVLVDKNNKANLTFKNMPIYWDVTPDL